MNDKRYFIEIALQSATCFNCNSIQSTEWFVDLWQKYSRRQKAIICSACLVPRIEYLQNKERRGQDVLKMIELGKQSRSVRTKKDRAKEDIMLRFVSPQQYRAWVWDHKPLTNDKNEEIIIGHDENNEIRKGFTLNQIKKMSQKQRSRWGIPACVCSILNHWQFFLKANYIIGGIEFIHSKNCLNKWNGELMLDLVGNEHTVTKTEKESFRYQCMGEYLDWVPVPVKNNNNE